MQGEVFTLSKPPQITHVIIGRVAVYVVGFLVTGWLSPKCEQDQTMHKYAVAYSITIHVHCCIFPARNRGQKPAHTRRPNTTIRSSKITWKSRNCSRYV